MDIYPLQHDRNIWHMGCNVNYRLHYEKKSCYEFESALSEWCLAVDRRSNDIWPALAARPIPARSAFESLPAPCLHRARSHSAVVGWERLKRKRGTPAISNPGLARLKWRLRHGWALSTCAAIGFVVVGLARLVRIALAHARLS